MSKRRVVVTGMGIKSPVGNRVPEAWQAIREGRSGIGEITHFDTEDFAVRIAGEVRDFDVESYMEPKLARKMDPFIHYGVAAAIDAFRDSKLEVDQHLAARVGVAVGAGIGGIQGIQDTCKAYFDGGPRKISPFFVPSTIINMVAGHISIELGLKGPNFGVVSACTTAAHNIGVAARMIRYGDADAMIAGGCEYATTPVAIGGFQSARALSRRNDAPARASRPWDTDRDGFVLSDGAGVIMLEEREFARLRGAPIYAEIVGFGASGDAHHMTASPEDGEGAALAMEAALRDADLSATDIGYLNAHATSTGIGDLAETRAIKSAFGSAAYDVPVSSTKSMTGHLLGAAGGVEAIFCILALRDQVLPPTINLDQAAPECDLDYVPHKARDGSFEFAMSNSFGFGGTNGTLIFAKP